MHMPHIDKITADKNDFQRNNPTAQSGCPKTIRSETRFIATTNGSVVYPHSEESLIIIRWYYGIQIKSLFTNVQRYSSHVYVCNCVRYISYTTPSLPSGENIITFRWQNLNNAHSYIHMHMYRIEMTIWMVNGKYYGDSNCNCRWDLFKTGFRVNFVCAK